eukprot:4304861-Amphidinium_carterae.1
MCIYLSDQGGYAVRGECTTVASGEPAATLNKLRARALALAGDARWKHYWIAVREQSPFNHVFWNTNPGFVPIVLVIHPTLGRRTIL